MIKRKEDFMKTLPTKIDPKYSNMTPDQLARFEDMLDKLRPVYDQVNATHLLKHEHIDKIFIVTFPHKAYFDKIYLWKAKLI